MTRAEADKILFIAVSMGEALLGCGAEVARVEDTVSRIVLSYGAESVDVFLFMGLVFHFPTFLSMQVCFRCVSLRPFEIKTHELSPHVL